MLRLIYFILIFSWVFFIWLFNSLHINFKMTCWNGFVDFTGVCLENLWLFGWFFLFCTFCVRSPVEWWNTLEIYLLNGNAVHLRCFVKVFVFSFCLVLIKVVFFADWFFFWKTDMLAIGVLVFIFRLSDPWAKNKGFSWKLRSCLFNACRPISNLFDSPIRSKTVAHIFEWLFSFVSFNSIP